MYVSIELWLFLLSTQMSNTFLNPAKLLASMVPNGNEFQKLIVHYVQSISFYHYICCFSLQCPLLLVLCKKQTQEDPVCSPSTIHYFGFIYQAPTYSPPLQTKQFQAFLIQKELFLSIQLYQILSVLKLSKRPPGRSVITKFSLYFLRVPLWRVASTEGRVLFVCPCGFSFASKLYTTL